MDSKCSLPAKGQFLSSPGIDSCISYLVSLFWFHIYMSFYLIKCSGSGLVNMHLSLDVSPFSDPFLSINLCCFFMVFQEGGAEDATVVGVTSMDCHWNLNGRKESFAMDLWTSIPLVLQVYYVYIYIYIYI